MTALQSAESVAAFHAALAHFRPEAPASANIPKPSAWAAQQLGFHAEPKQAEALDSTAPRLAVRAARQWGKSTLLAIKALHTAVFRPGEHILVLTLTSRNATLFSATLRQMAARLGYPPRPVQGIVRSLELPNSSQIRIESRDVRAAGLTGPARTILVDGEDPSLPAPALLRAGGELWFFATPAGPSGLLYNIWTHSAYSAWTRIQATVDDVPSLCPAYIGERTQLSPCYAPQDLYADFGAAQNDNRNAN